MCDKAVQKHAELLEYVPDKFKTQKMCEEAIRRSTIAFKYVLDEFKTQEMCDDVRLESEALCYILDQFKTQEICDRFISKDIKNISFIPDRFKTREMCLRALKYSTEHWNYIFRNDPEFIEVMRCKGEKGNCQRIYTFKYGCNNKN